MSDERMRILKMVAEGKVQPDEAERLLESVGNDPSAVSYTHLTLPTN